MDPTVTIGAVTVACALDSLTVTVASIGVAPDTAELNDFGINIGRIGRVIPEEIPYQPTQWRKSWGFGWWSGSNDPMPDIPYVLNTADDWLLVGGERGSWTNHSEMGPPGSLDPTSFWEVGVWAGAVNTTGKGNRGNRAWGWENVSFTIDCSTGIRTDSPEFTWCFEDEWTHEQEFEGLVTWVEGSDTPVDCTW